MHLKLYTVASSSKLATDFYLCINAIDALINTHMQAFKLTTVLSVFKGFNADDFGEKVFQAFGPGSPYDNPVTADYAKGKQDKRYPIQSKWVTFMLSRFTKLYSEKKKLEDETEEDTNDDPDSIARCVPLVALYTGNPEMLSTAYDACSMIQSSDIILTIVLAACRVMEQYMLQDGTEADGSPQVEKVIGDLKSAKRTFPNDLDLAVSGFLADALATKEMTVDEATAKLGKA